MVSQVVGRAAIFGVALALLPSRAEAAWTAAIPPPNSAIDFDSVGAATQTIHTETIAAGRLTNGPVAASVLPSTVAYTSVGSTFTVNQTFSSATIQAYFVPPILTKAQIWVSTPTVGQMAVCSNCTRPYTVCSGTGAVKNGWREIGLATGCQ